MTDKDRIQEAIERTRGAKGKLPEGTHIGVQEALKKIAHRPDESKKVEKSPEEIALDAMKKANKGPMTIAGLTGAEQTAAQAMEKVDKAIEKSKKTKPEKDKELTKEKGEQQKDPKGKEDKEKGKEDEKKKISSNEKEEAMKKKFSHVELPSGLIIKAEGQSWNLYDKKGNYMDVTSQMNQLIAHNRGVDEANHAQDMKMGKVKVDENNLPVRGVSLKGNMVESSVNKINTGDLQVGKDNFDLKKLDVPDIKKVSEIAVDRAFDENNLRLLRELEEKKKENENRKEKEAKGPDLAKTVLDRTR